MNMYVDLSVSSANYNTNYIGHDGYFLYTLVVRNYRIHNYEDSVVAAIL